MQQQPPLQPAKHSTLTVLPMEPLALNTTNVNPIKPKMLAIMEAPTDNASGVPPILFADLECAKMPTTLMPSQ